MRMPPDAHPPSTRSSIAGADPQFRGWRAFYSGLTPAMRMYSPTYFKSAFGDS
jgi:hypothetical protein